MFSLLYVLFGVLLVTNNALRVVCAVCPAPRPSELSNTLYHLIPSESTARRSDSDSAQLTGGNWLHDKDPPCS